MCALLRWAESDRDTVRGALSEALVLVSLGATEQHGPHLPTGTDALLSATVCERAGERAAAESVRPLLLAPPLALGASDHHLPFGGTLSLSPQTLLAVLDDLARSISAQGGRRLVVVNGHGGNAGVCHAFAGAAAHHHGLSVAYLDYWRVLDRQDVVPGHAGEFETSLVLAIRGELVRPRPPREQPPEPPRVSDVDIHSGQIWHDLDGYTDQPALATPERGQDWLDRIVAGLAARFVALAKVM